MSDIDVGRSIFKAGQDAARVNMGVNAVAEELNRSGLGVSALVGGGPDSWLVFPRKLKMTGGSWASTKGCVQVHVATIEGLIADQMSVADVVDMIQKQVAEAGDKSPDSWQPPVQPTARHPAPLPVPEEIRRPAARLPVAESEPEPSPAPAVIADDADLLPGEPDFIC